MSSSAAPALIGLAPTGLGLAPAGLGLAPTGPGLAPTGRRLLGELDPEGSGQGCREHGTLQDELFQVQVKSELGS